MGLDASIYAEVAPRRWLSLSIVTVVITVVTTLLELFKHYVNGGRTVYLGLEAWPRKQSSTPKKRWGRGKFTSIPFYRHV